MFIWYVIEKNVSLIMVTSAFYFNEFIWVILLLIFRIYIIEVYYLSRIWSNMQILEYCYTYIVKVAI